YCHPDMGPDVARSAGGAPRELDSGCLACAQHSWLLLSRGGGLGPRSGEWKHQHHAGATPEQRSGQRGPGRGGSHGKRRRGLPAGSQQMIGAVRQRRSGFTLVELLVAMALTLFIMVILSQAFIAGVQTFADLKAIGDMNNRLRVASSTL